MICMNNNGHIWLKNWRHFIGEGWVELRKSQMDCDCSWGLNSLCQQYIIFIHIIYDHYSYMSYITIRKSWNILGFNAKEEKPAVKKNNMRNDCQGKCLQSTIVLSSTNMRNLRNDFQGKSLESKIVLTSKPNSSFSLCKRTLCDTLINSKSKTSDICIALKMFDIKFPSIAVYL